MALQVCNRANSNGIRNRRMHGQTDYLRPGYMVSFQQISGQVIMKLYEAQ